MSVRRILLGAIAVIVLLVLGGSVLIWRPAIAPISASERPSVDEQTYTRGAELKLIGDWCRRTKRAWAISKDSPSQA